MLHRAFLSILGPKFIILLTNLSKTAKILPDTVQLIRVDLYFVILFIFVVLKRPKINSSIDKRNRD